MAAENSPLDPKKEEDCDLETVVISDKDRNSELN